MNIVCADGNKVISSVNKDGELIKKIIKDTFNTRDDNLVDKTIAWTSRNKYWDGVKPYIKYKYTKIFPKSNSIGLEIASLDRTYAVVF